MPTKQHHSAFTVGQRVRVSNGAPKPPAHHKKKLRAWQRSNFTGVVQRVEPERSYQPNGGLSLSDDSINSNGVMTFLFSFTLGGQHIIDIIEEEAQAKYRFIEDPGHGWLEVPMDELEALGIADKISRYSYRDYSKGLAYLEEDCDMAVFGRAKNWNEAMPDLETEYQENTFVRRLDHYDYYTGA